MRENEADEILNYIGGESNVNDVYHCATRLRFELDDEDAANTEAIEKLPYVLSVVQSGGQYQIIIGQDVGYYYDSIEKILDTNVEQKNNIENKSSKKGFSIFNTISGAFTPLIPVLAGAGMVKAVVTLLVQLGWLAETSETFLVFSAAGNSVFYFLPVFLGYTIANQFKANPFVGAAIGAALLEPSYTSLIGEEGLSLLGIPITATDYSSTVFPIFIAMLIYIPFEKLLKKYTHENLKLFVVPMLSLIVLVPATIIIFGPIGTYVGSFISSTIIWIYNLNNAIAGFVVGSVYPFLTMLGLHWGFTPITLENLVMYNTDVIEGMAVASVFAQIGVAIGVFFKSHKGSKNRTASAPMAITGILAGVTEPILYGLVVQYKRLPIVLAIAGGVGGAINGMLNVGMDSYVFHHIWSIITGAYSPMLPFLIGITTALILGIVLTYFWGIKDEDMGDFK